MARSGSEMGSRLAVLEEMPRHSGRTGSQKEKPALARAGAGQVNLCRAGRADRL
jgi:hypothetical protein